jgi:hypothetical protein
MTTLTTDQRERLAASFPKPETETITCPACQGTGLGRWDRPCYECNGATTLTIDPDAVLAACMNSRTGRFRGSSPKRSDQGGVYGARFVWRMIRFHTGLDMSMPMMVTMEHSRSMQDRLHALADWAAWEIAGERSLRGALRWGRALGTI